MGLDEQREEREVLASIFPDEITDISETEFRVAIALDDADATEDREEEAPVIVLQVQYPPAYPDVAPHLELSSPPNAPKHELLDLAEDRGGLLDALAATVEESLGIAMVFSLVSALKENAEALMAERRAAAQAVREVEARRAEVIENAKFHGTQVTRDSFLAWSERFTKETEEQEQQRREEQEAEDAKRRRGPREEVKLTGRQIWERGLAGKVDEDEEGEEEMPAIQKVKIGA